MKVDNHESNGKIIPKKPNSKNANLKITEKNQNTGAKTVMDVIRNTQYFESNMAY